METTRGWNVFDHRCPTRQVLDRIADKWTVLVVQLLSERTMRFGDLKRSIGGISQKVLTSTLRGLERDGLVVRRVHASVPPGVEYSLTELGRSLTDLVAAICRWAETHIEQVEAARASFDRAAASAGAVEADAARGSAQACAHERSGSVVNCGQGTCTP